MPSNDDSHFRLQKKLLEHQAATIRTTDNLVRSEERGDSEREFTPRSASAQITQANKIAARADSSAKTPASSRATFESAYKTPGSGPKPLSQLKPLPPAKPGIAPMLSPKLPRRK